MRPRACPLSTGRTPHLTPKGSAASPATHLGLLVSTFESYFGLAWTHRPYYYLSHIPSSGLRVAMARSARIWFRHGFTDWGLLAGGGRYSGQLLTIGLGSQSELAAVCRKLLRRAGIWSAFLSCVILRLVASFLPCFSLEFSPHLGGQCLDCLKKLRLGELVPAASGGCQALGP